MIYPCKGNPIRCLGMEYDNFIIKNNLTYSTFWLRLRIILLINTSKTLLCNLSIRLSPDVKRSTIFDDDDTCWRTPHPTFARKLTEGKNGALQLRYNVPSEARPLHTGPHSEGFLHLPLSSSFSLLNPVLRINCSKQLFKTSDI